MDARRLRIGEWAMVAAGVVLLVSLFLPWYSTTGLAAADADAWQAFGVIDVVLFLLAVGAISVIPVTAGPSTPSPAIAYQALLCLAAIAAAILVLFRVLDPPAAGLSREIGCYLGAAATLGVVAACLVALRDERLSAPGRPTDATGLPVEAAPSVESVPVPRP